MKYAFEHPESFKLYVVCSSCTEIETDGSVELNIHFSFTLEHVAIDCFLEVCMLTFLSYRGILWHQIMCDIKHRHHWIIEYLPLWIFFCEMILLIDHALQTRVEEAEWSSVLFQMNMNELKWIMSMELLRTCSVLGTRDTVVDTRAGNLGVLVDSV